ncbi:unnamed protein product, partial [Mesorhabditis spiculigera]
MPPEGVELTPKSHLLSNDEIITLAKIFAKRGVNKIRLTGGEPTLRKDLDYLIAQLKAIPGIEEIGITTNGLILKRILPKLKEAGLDKINISLDSLIPAKFEKMTRIFGFEKVMASIKAAEDLMGRIKINVVVMRGYNVNEIVDFVELTKKRNLDIRFIEFMPFGGNEFSKSTFVSYAEQLALIREKFGDALVRLPDGENDTSKAYKIEGHIGQFGFISSMSENFCSTCNRIRLTANGNLKVCLHSNAETSLLKVLRAGGTEEDIEKTIREALQGKHRQHAGLDNLLHLENRPMVLIGGLISPNAGLNFLTFTKSTPLAIPHRSYSTKALTHVSSTGSARQVDVSNKVPTRREAIAQATIKVTPEIFIAIKENNLKKGDVLAVANIASIQASKHTSNLIPLCHNIPISQCKTKFEMDETSHTIIIETSVVTVSQTGVEMEALTAVTIAALTIYDMCKAISQNMQINNVRLVSKTGGKSDISPSTVHEN